MARFFAASGDKSSPDITSKPSCQVTNSRSRSSRTSSSSPPSKELARPAGGNTKNGDGKSNGNVHRRNRRPRLRRQNGQDFDHLVEKSRVSTPARSSSDLFGSGFTEAPSSASSVSSRSQLKICCACSPSVSIVEDLPGEVSEDDFSWLDTEPTVSVAPSAAVEEAEFPYGDAHKDEPSISRKGKKQQQPRQQQQQQPRRHKNPQRIRPKYLAPLELRVEEFECGDCIGKGSYSRVFLGTHMPSGTEWALKVVSKRKTFETRENLAHLREEKKISAKLQSSDFLVRTAGTFQNPRSVVFAMEYLPGGDLYQRLADKGTLPLGETVAWVAQAVLAIEDLHALDIVHRDVKPENFLMGKSGTLKLTDFGFARELAPGERLLSQFGTPEYVAPEVLNGCGHGKPVDLWALGILIYELLVGHTPFKADSVDDMYERISSGDYAFPAPVSKASPSPSPTRSRRQDIRNERRPPSNKRSEAEAEGKGGRVEGCPNKVVEKKEEIDDAQDPAAQSLVKSLLSLAPARRPSIAEIKDHPFFEGVNFDALRAAVRAQAYAEEEEALVTAAVAGGDLWLRDQPVICLSENVDDHYGNVFADF